jgi:hypothetical protein
MPDSRDGSKIGYGGGNDSEYYDEDNDYEDEDEDESD